MDIIAFSKDWHEPKTSNNHVLEELAQRHRVLWVNSIATRTPNLASGNDLRKIGRKLRQFTQGVQVIHDRLRVLTPVVLPLPGSTLAQRLNRWLVGAKVRRAARQWGLRSPELWIFPPNAVDYVGAFGESKVVYYCVDEWSQFRHLNAALIRAKERLLLQKADVVFVVSQKLLADKAPFNPNTHLIPHGVNWEMWAGEYSVPEDLARLRGCQQDQRPKTEDRRLLPGAARSAAVGRGSPDPVPTPTEGLQPIATGQEALTEDGPPASGAAALANQQPESPIESPGAVASTARREDASRLQSSPREAPGDCLPSSVFSLQSPSSAAAVVGFYGNLYDWVDQDLLAGIARARPQWQIVLIGKLMTDVRPLQACPNLHLLGPRPYEQLPAYCRGFDVGLIPYRTTDPRMESVNPLKLREYLAAGLPVVTVDIPEVRALGEAVYRASGVEQFVHAIEMALAQNTAEERRQRQESMREHSWSARVASIEQILTK